MIEGFEPYSSMKPSGCSWLGDIPSHWSMRRNGGLFARRVEYGTPGLPILEVSLKTGVRVRNMDGTGRKQAMSDQGKYRCARRGDIAYNSMRMWQGAVGVSPTDGLISPAYVVAKPLASVVSGYYASLFKTPMFMKEVIDWSRGIVMDRNRLYWDQFKQIAVPIFDSDEQAAIVRFLDHANRTIVDFIRSKRKLIGLLNDQKQAIIHRAVTRGLDPHVPLKPSGIPWLGDIPQHWEVSSLRMRYSVELGKMLDAKKITGRHLVPYLRNRDVQWDKIHVDDLPLMDISLVEFPRYTVSKGDLLVCEGGQVGRCAFWNEELPVCGFQKALHRIRASSMRRDFPRFFFYQMQLAAGLGIFAADGNENTIAHLTCEKLRSHRFAFPPHSEQEVVAKYLDAELQTANTAIARTEREIALMQEYRTRLTADVVTGKLDVRAAAASLPANTEQVAVAPDTDGDDQDPDEDADA